MYPIFSCRLTICDVTANSHTQHNKKCMTDGKENFSPDLVVYFSHSTGTTQWVDPRLAQVKKATVDECDEDGRLTVAALRCLGISHYKAYHHFHC